MAGLSKMRKAVSWPPGAKRVRAWLCKYKPPLSFWTPAGLLRRIMLCWIFPAWRATATLGLLALLSAPAGAQTVSQVNQAPNVFNQNNYEVDVAVNPLNPQQVVAAYIKDFGQITLLVGVSVS